MGLKTFICDSDSQRETQSAHLLFLAREQLAVPRCIFDGGGFWLAVSG